MILIFFSSESWDLILFKNHIGGTLRGHFHTYILVWIHCRKTFSPNFSGISNQNIRMKVSPKCPPDMIFQKYEISAFTGKKNYKIWSKTRFYAKKRKSTKNWIFWKKKWFFHRISKSTKKNEKIAIFFKKKLKFIFN